MNVYKNTNVEVYWLTKEEYPRYWIYNENIYDSNTNKANCSTIYGCQGFEADYVGVIWGRDMVWRKSWDLGENCEDEIKDTKITLKSLFEYAKKYGDTNAKTKVLKLLKNRYRIFLTRGILGTYIFCEDEETRNYLSEIIPEFNNSISSHKTPN